MSETYSMQTIKVTGWYVIRNWMGEKTYAYLARGGVSNQPILDGPFAYRMDAEEAAR